MNYEKEYNLKRKNFIKNTKKYFEFLILEFNFNPATYKKYEQPNKVVTRDEFIFKKNDKILIISNSYHPVDYGFDIRVKNTKTSKEELLYYKLKEKQDTEQSYIKDIALLLKEEYKDKL